MKVAVLISGGVDSSVALKLLQEQGHEVSAFYLKIWLEDELAFLGSCPWEEDLSYVQQVCSQAQVPLQVLNLQKTYWDEVVSYAIAEIKAGRTPNSDLMCNAKVKFGKFYDLIDASFDLVATGHYADKIQKNGLFYLKTTPDPIKDQTYFLAHLTQRQLSRATFPLGQLNKTQVRQLAAAYNLPNQARKDSQGVCFLGKIKYKEFVKFHLGEEKGDLIEYETGRKLGEHPGFWFFTVGQRKGIELSGGPWFVVKKDHLHNRVFISNHYHQEDLARRSCRLENLHWIALPPTAEQLQILQVKIRHGSHFYNCLLKIDPINPQNGDLTLSEDDQGLAPGQFAVFYADELCLGAGTIAVS